MNRRTYLASLAALTTGSGCISNATSQNSSNRMEEAVSVSNVERRPPAEPEKLDEDERPTDRPRVRCQGRRRRDYAELDGTGNAHVYERRREHPQAKYRPGATGPPVQQCGIPGSHSPVRRIRPDPGSGRLLETGTGEFPAAGGRVSTSHRTGRGGNAGVRRVGRPAAGVRLSQTGELPVRAAIRLVHPNGNDKRIRDVKLDSLHHR